MRQVLGLAARDRANGLFLELDRHDGYTRLSGCEIVGKTGRGGELSGDRGWGRTLE